MTSVSITPSVLAARWAYVELRSPRFASTYDLPTTHPIRRKSMAQVPFESLLEADIGLLRDLLKRHPDRGPGFYPVLMSFSAYTLRAYDRDALSNVSLAPGLGWERFGDFAAGQTASSIGVELRAELDAVPPGPFVPTEPPIIVPCVSGAKRFSLLLEGTLRSLLYAREQVPPQKLDVWVPTEDVPLQVDEGPSWL